MPLGDGRSAGRTCPFPSENATKATLPEGWAFRSCVPLGARPGAHGRSAHRPCGLTTGRALGVHFTNWSLALSPVSAPNTQIPGCPGLRHQVCLGCGRESPSPVPAKKIIAAPDAPRYESYCNQLFARKRSTTTAAALTGRRFVLFGTSSNLAKRVGRARQRIEPRNDFVASPSDRILP